MTNGFPRGLRPSHCLAAALACLVPAVGGAAEGAMESLRHFYESVDTLTASFTQEQLDSELNVEKVSEGRVWLQRPDRFRWAYDKPDRRVIVSTGEKLEIYETDLEQVTVQPVSKALAATPAQLLAGGPDLRERFEITVPGEVGETRWVKLVPRTDETDFKEVRLGFREGEIAVMELKDDFGDTTRIRFQDVEINEPIGAERFELDVPDNVDVVGGSGS